MTERKSENIQQNRFQGNKTSHDGFYKPIHTQSYINSMAMPAICDRVAPIQNIPEPVRFQNENIPEIKFVTRILFFYNIHFFILFYFILFGGLKGKK